MLAMTLPPREAAPLSPPPRPGTGAATPLRVHRAGDAGRAAVEQFIRRIYRERFGAEVQQFAPVLVSRHDAAGALVAAAGYRAADTGALFLERYLGQPVEQRLADEGAAAPARARIAEVGHLAADRHGEGRRLILQLGPHLADGGFQWVVSTLTEELRHLFLRLGIAPRALGVADPALLGAEAAHWGRYYDHHPVVLAGRIDQALAALARHGQARA